MSVISAQEGVVNMPSLNLMIPLVVGIVVFKTFNMFFSLLVYITVSCWACFNKSNITSKMVPFLKKENS